MCIALNVFVHVLSSRLLSSTYDSASIKTIIPLQHNLLKTSKTHSALGSS